MNRRTRFVLAWLDSRVGVLAWLLLPKRVRRSACEAADEHAPVLVDLGRRKLCMNCGVW